MTDITEIRFAGNDMMPVEWDEIWEILCECNNEFVPPLSSRNSSSQTDLATGEKGGECNGHIDDKPDVYFKEIQKQQLIIAKRRDSVIGFLTFKTEYICDALSDFGVSNYITTVCVGKKFRKQGILTQMYERMENNLPDSVRCSRISTRTWSQNNAQINTLIKRGFRILKTLQNDRGPGIDTLYFGKD